MSDLHDPAPDLSAVPLFPLPNVVLFPKAVLPLHIFEDRYRAMTADALAGHRQVAMALLDAGWEKNYHGRPVIQPVVCVGAILSHEQLPDGRYNFLLQGHTRARIVREFDGELYRMAELEPLAEVAADEASLQPARRKLAHLFDDGTLLATGIGRQFRQIVSSPLPTADVADLIAFNFLEDVPLKQSLLADPDVRRRVNRTVDAFEAVRPALQPASPPSRPRPSLN